VRNALRIEINGSAGSLAFDLERLNELELYDATESGSSIWHTWRCLRLHGSRGRAVGTDLPHAQRDRTSAPILRRSLHQHDLSARSRNPVPGGRLIRSPCTARRTMLGVTP
jgi:hypothetical protein